MKLPLARLPQHPLTLLLRHATFMALVLGLCFDGWLVWRGWQQWIDQPLPPERVTAKALRVNEVDRLTFVKNNAQDHQPLAVPTAPTVAFKGTVPSK